MASTVGVGTVLDSRGVIAVVTGLRQGLPLRKKTIVWIEEGMNHSAGNNQKQRDWRVVHWTLPALQIHSWSLVVCDKDTAGLRTKTSGIIMDRVAYPEVHSHRVYPSLSAGARGVKRPGVDHMKTTHSPISLPNVLTLSDTPSLSLSKALLPVLTGL
ncbi:Glucosamine-6-phosphate isomerase (Glucosamine-6-phosphate deaminase) (GNPDA) (GlcN6P deaminase) [Ceratobasidium sp. UAMH 11750]|nr:Glucosamine-6-phosphate isomerase (Glucosamine-6-phosphate deaminase) (GNPDA) (GlcN6P deaminase) [Ceratobasidium sp. UAMH 11750]